MKARGDLPPNSPPFTLYHMEVVKKCYKEKFVLRKAHAFVLRHKLNEEEGKATMLMNILSMVYHMKIIYQCMKEFFLTRLQKFFKLKPVEMDARRVDEFLTALQDNGTCRIIDRDGGLIKIIVDSDMVTRALRLI